MDTEKVIEFLREVASTLGPAGEHAYNLIKARVIAEAIIGVAFWGGILLLVVITTIILIKWFKGHSFYYNTDKEIAGTLITIAPILLSILMLTGLLESVVNLLSPDYATIERILNLVTGTR